MTTLSIRLPLDAEPGDSLTFSVNGQNMEIDVPIGSNPGDVLEIQLGSDRDDDAPRNTTTTAIPMKTGGEIVLHSVLPEKDRAANILSSDGTHQMVWPACLALVRFFTGNGLNNLFNKKTIESVLELGSGLGGLGLAFSHLLSQEQCTAQVTLSDMPSAIPLLDYNIQQNLGLMSPSVNISTVPLVWHCYPVPSSTSLDLILGSDLLYNAVNIPALVATIKRLTSSKTWIILSVRWRKPDLERSFFMQLSDIIEWQLLDGPCPLGWREYGNPSSAKSNSYFSQTMVGVQGKPFSLASIDEAKTSHMTSDEFEAWENLQTQIYLGRFTGPTMGIFAPESKRQKMTSK